MDYSSTDRRLENVVWFDESQAIQMVGSKSTVLCISTSDWWWQCKDVLEIIFGTLWAPLVADCVHAFTTTVCPFSIGSFQHVTVLKWPQRSPDLNPTEHLWDVTNKEICIMD